MAKGVKKIAVHNEVDTNKNVNNWMLPSKGIYQIPGVTDIYEIKNGVYINLSNPGNNLLVVAPDTPVYFTVLEWYSGTTESDKKANLTWIYQDSQKIEIVKQKILLPTQKYPVKIPKKYCGSYTYYLEASLSGKRDFKTETGVYIRGYCQPKIINSAWSKIKAGKDDRKSHQFSYGDTIYLNLQTEGLNGDLVSVTIFNNVKFKIDPPIIIYTHVKVIDGEINLEINNTYSWYGKLGVPTSTQLFYVKVQKHGSKEYIKDNNGDTEHARFLRIKPNVSSQKIAPSKTNAPYKIGAPDINTERFEPCKFEQIKITETKTEDGKKAETSVLVFDNGKGLTGTKSNFTEAITKSIYFNFDAAVLEAESKVILENILNFLLTTPGTNVSLRGYACVIGKQNHNKALSQSRVDAVKNYFISQGLNSNRIQALAMGEIDPTDDKLGNDNVNYKNEQNFKLNRRVDIVFTYYFHDADTIIYETVAPSKNTQKQLKVNVIGHETHTCFSTSNAHKPEIDFLDIKKFIEQAAPVVQAKAPANLSVYSNLSKFDKYPLQYIWPVNSTPNQFALYINSCRWYSNNKKATVLIKAYPDIKWELFFFINLSNELAIDWTKGQEEKRLEEYKNKAKELAEEDYEKAKKVAFGFSLKAEWDNSTQKNDFSYEYKTQSEKLFKLFASLGSFVNALTKTTGGDVRTTPIKGLPMAFAVKPPNVKLTGNWHLAHPSDNKQKLGTNIYLKIEAKPLLEVELSIDLLLTAVVVAGAAVAIPPNPKVIDFVKTIRELMKRGVGYKNDKANVGAKASADLYLDLIVTGTISGEMVFKFNTAGKVNEAETLKVEIRSKLKVELKAGVTVKGEVLIVVVTASGYFEFSGSGIASVTSAHQLINNANGLYYKPQLGFDGLDVSYKCYISVGLAVKKEKSKHKLEQKRKSEFINETYKGLIPPFDVVKNIEKITGITMQVPIIKNNKN